MIKFLRCIINFTICKILYRIEYINLDKNRQLDGKLVICANHNDWLDTVILWTKTEKVKVMAKKELFKNPIVSRFLTSMGAFPIDRGGKDFKSVYHAVNEVNKNNNLVIFPEGTRKAKQKNIRAKIGAIYIAIASEADIVPVYIEEGNRRIFRKIKVVYGTPYNLNEYKDKIKDKDVLRKLTDELMEKIYKLGEDINAR